MTFYGYKRPDGRVGVRNKVLILPASVCASDTTRIIAQQVVGSVTFNNQQGCSQVASDQQLTMDVMAGYAANPNIYGTVVVSLGCENCQMDLVVKAIQERTNKPLKQVIIQEVGGTLKAVDIAVRYAKEMVAEASLLQKEEFPISELIVGTECGGSDPTSGLAANPVIGEMSDRIVAAGGTSILSETTEFIGAEHILARAATDIHERLLLRNGAEAVIYPVKLAANYAATRYTTDNVIDYLALTEDFSICEITTPAGWVGHSIAELDVRRRHNINIIAIKEGAQMKSMPWPDHVFSIGEDIMIMGHNRDLRKFLR